MPLPDTLVVKAAMEYVKKELPEHTFNHSMRVFYYGEYRKQIFQNEMSNSCILQEWQSRLSSSPSGNSVPRLGY
jgi:hypothetical protein